MVNAGGVSIERLRHFGDAYLGLLLWDRLGLARRQYLPAVRMFPGLSCGETFGSAKENSQARRGYSRDGRPDCPQVCIGLVTTKEGLPVAYEVFDGNRTNVTTTQEMVSFMEKKYGKAGRVWVMDRGMVYTAHQLDGRQSEDHMGDLYQTYGSGRLLPHRKTRPRHAPDLS